MIHSILKRSTAELHNSLERRLSFLLSSELSLAQYVTLQKQFYGFYQPIETRLAEVRNSDVLEFDLDQRLKVPLLINDLTHLGVAASEREQIPLCDSLPAIETAAEALGCLYVLEGSTLGGTIITGHLKKALYLDEHWNCSFFNSYGDDVGRMWSAFVGVLRRHCQNYGDTDVMVRTACHTFASLDQWFSDVA